jgi:concentrative nucleoside transporter, CNT family
MSSYLDLTTYATMTFVSPIRPTVIVGLFLQQAIALFVLKSTAGFDIFKWLAFLAADFLQQSQAGAIFFFDTDVVITRHWFFVGVVCTVSHLISTVLSC